MCVCVCAGELHYRVEHCLLALPGISKGQIQRVISHPQALAQCQDYLSQWGGCTFAIDSSCKRPSLFLFLSFSLSLSLCVCVCVCVCRRAD